MNRIAAGVTPVILLVATAAAVGSQSRLETDFDRHYNNMGFLCLKYSDPIEIDETVYAYTVGGAIRKIEWVRGRGTAHHMTRDIYFSGGKPQLVIERRFQNLDKSGNALRVAKLEYTRRYWLHDRTAGDAGLKTRQELKGQAESLASDVLAHKSDWR
jgi:hypothetical protein